MFDAATTVGIIFTAATGVDANAITQVQTLARRRMPRTFVRRGLLPRDDAWAMEQWQHGGGFSVDGSVRIEATDRARRAFALGSRSPWTGYGNTIPDACSMRAPSPVRARAAHGS